MRGQRLDDLPDWSYLLQTCYQLYRFQPSGGSEPIRTHQRFVREALNRLIHANPPLQEVSLADKPVTAHLRRALDEGKRERHATLIRAIEAIHTRLHWQYGYEKVPRGLEKKFAYAQFCGPQGPIPAKEVILGIVLFAPGCVYPAHAHDGITESYLCLSGSVSENHQGVYAVGSMIFNPPAHTHRITVSQHQPALLLYAWLGEEERLERQQMVFIRKRKNQTCPFPIPP
ncbi:dimethylsulfonioproprionate lyase family protein [Desulfogranum mediterraneum]|uniref:dimethylsulfonioproprionate lyase family protein n=1 Tax=Desulfogranum mediterraneum TaxID=160661 RepID=UPI000424CF03|nr:dimethylsulfonioproprionate lyase family protein [Desulfogranum mediterraneum]